LVAPRAPDLTDQGSRRYRRFGSQSDPNKLGMLLLHFERQRRAHSLRKAATGSTRAAR
jgi:hypothetical protein